MKNLERIEAIVLLLNSRPGLTTVQLAEACGVELRLMIEALAEMMLAQDRIFAIYPKLEEKNVDSEDINDEPELKDEIMPETKWFCKQRDSNYIPVRLTAEECVRLNEVLELLPDGQAKQSIMKKLQNCLGAIPNRRGRFMKKADEDLIPEIAEDVFPVLQSAIRGRKKVSIIIDFETGPVLVTPMRIMYDTLENTWSLLAYDGKELQNFNLSSVYHLTISSDRREFYGISNVDNWRGNDDSMPPSTTAKLMMHDAWSTEDKESKELEHHHVSNKNEFVTWVLSAEDSMEILEPQEFRQEIITRLKDTLRWYENTTC